MRTEKSRKAMTYLIKFTAITFILISCSSKIHQPVVIPSFPNGYTGLNFNNLKENSGDHDNLHYLSNYLEDEVDTLHLLYLYNLCLCPKWEIESTPEKVWIEHSSDSLAVNYSDINLEGKDITVTGRFYKYQGIPLNLYSFNYLSEKHVPNARIFKIEKFLKRP